jgi:hypothetical protein
MLVAGTLHSTAKSAAVLHGKAATTPVPPAVPPDVAGFQPANRCVVHDPRALPSATLFLPFRQHEKTMSKKLAMRVIYTVILSITLVTS